MSKTSAVTVGLVQITEPDEFLVFLPYTAALLQVYAQAHAPNPERYTFLTIQFQRKSLELAAKELGAAQIVGFSSYIWNYAYNLNLARLLKQQHPDMLIVFGGPQVPNAPAEFLAKYPFIDVCVHGEGEETFLRVLEAWPAKQFQDIPGISFRGPAHECITQPPKPRIQDLDQIPSPYLSGLFEPLMQQHPEIAWGVLWETNRGCPFSCTFCDWGSNTKAKVSRFGMERLQQEMEWFGRNRIHFVFGGDANFGILPRDVEIARQLVATHKTYGFPQKVITQMTKNQLDRAFDTHLVLHQAGLLQGATLSLQAVNANVLQAVKRDNISLPVYRELLRRFMQHGIRTYTDILIGLPGETFDSFAQGIADLLTMGQYDELRFYHTFLLPNAELSEPEYRKRYGIETIVIPFYSSYRVSRRKQEIIEEYEMVVSTNTLPRADWIRTRALAWLSMLIYYNDLIQIPLLLLHKLSEGPGGPGIPHYDLLMAFYNAPLPADTPVLHQLRQFLQVRAEAVILGQPESCLSTDPKTGEAIWLSAVGYVLASLLLGPKLGQFYAECEKLFEALLLRKGHTLPPGLLKEAIQLTQANFESRLAGKQNFSLDMSYNLLSCYQQIRHGQEPRLEAGAWRVSHVADAEGNYVLQEVSRVSRQVSDGYASKAVSESHQTIVTDQFRADQMA